MTTAFLPALVAVCAALPTPAPVSLGSSPSIAPTPVSVAARADTLEASLYRGGIPFSAFLENADSRRDTWIANYGRAEAPAPLVERASALAGGFRLLVIAEAACGDSANTIPYLAKFVESVDGLELRVVNSAVGRAVMDAHPTPDGRGATPTVVILDGSDQDVGCWVERPSGLQSWWMNNPDGLSTREKLASKYGWYDEDAGYHTVLEIVEALEAAERGEYRCALPADPDAGWPLAGPGGVGGGSPVR